MYRNVPYSAAYTLLKVSASSLVSFALIDGVQGLTGSGQQKNEIEYTAISDTAKKFMADLADFGEFQFQLAWDPTNAEHAILWANFIATGNTDIYFQVTMDDVGGAVYTFQGFVKQMSVSHQKGSFNAMDVVIRVNGAINLVP